MSRQCNVALVQARAARLDTEANIASSVREIERSAGHGASVVVLPELYASGYVDDRAALEPIAEDVRRPGRCLSAWMAAAREFEVAIVGGFAEKEGDRLFNSAVTIDPSGEVVSVYRKLHLFGSERDCFEPGDLGLPIVRVDDLMIGVVVCYDLRFPEVLRILALRGAELVAVPTAWVAGFDKSTPANGRIGQVDGVIVQANLNQIYVGCADQVGTSGQHLFLGRSIAISPFGEILAGPASPTEEELVIFAMDADEVDRARHRGKGIDPLENRRTDVYGDLLGYQEPAVPELERQR